MVTVTIFAESFDGGEELNDYEFPAVPRVGDSISIAGQARVKVEDVNYHIDGDNKVRVRVLIRRPYNYDLSKGL